MKYLSQPVAKIILVIMYILRLQRALDEAKGKYYDDKIRTYTGSIRCQKDIESLKNIGLTTEEVSRSIDVPVSFVQRQMIRIAQSNEERRRFHHGILPSSGGYYAILPR